MTQIGGSWAGAPALLTVTVASGTGEGRAAPETGGGGASVGAAGIDAAGSGVAAVTGTPPGEIEIVETAAAAALGTGAGDAITAPRGTGGNLGSTPFANALQMFPDTGAGGGLRGPPRRKSSFQPSSTAKSCTSASEISRGKRASK